MNSLRRTANLGPKCKLLLALLGVCFVQLASATIPLYQNNDTIEYAIPGNPPPQIDARAFDNENSFAIDYNTYHPGTPYYQTLNTYFFTNTGTMIANSPQTNAFNSLFFGFGNQNFGCGYKFTHYDGVQDGFADTFYNPGTIRAVSTIDGNSLFPGLFFFGNFQTTLSQLTSYGKVSVTANNILNPGTVDVSVNGYINLRGKNVDLTGGQLIVEPPLNAFGLDSISLSSVGAIGVDTNGDWNPGLDLGATYAISSFIPIPPFFIDLTNSQAYLDVRQVNPFYNVNRYVFVENNSPDVSYNVYIDDPNAVSLGFARGAAHVEWVANVTDPATGNTANSYLYLTDDYELGAATNNFLVNGVPLNFSFLVSPTQQLFNPQSPNFAPLPDAYMSNNYAAFNGSLLASTANTNISTVNPHGTITNLPGQIYISASNELNLAFTSISGPNYLNLNCTNQFDGSPGASIAVPFSDISLGVTNGTLVVSNVLMANLPNWSGTIQAFSSQWIDVDATTGITNEYKVMIVFSQLEPTSKPWVQNLYLHGTNQLVISDHLNVYGSLYGDARTVVLNTNQLGTGATSLDGELTWLNALNANSGSGVQQFPNLLWLTNNGAIRAAHNATFGNATLPPYAVSTPAVPGTAATATLSESGLNAVKMDRVTIGTNVYTFVTTLTNRAANQVKIAATFDGSMSNLIAAINRGSGAGTLYSTNTRANPLVTAGRLLSHAFTVTARAAGSVGNSIPTLFTPATAAIDLTWSSPTLANGTDLIPAVLNPTAFVNHSLISDQGLAIWTGYFENSGLITNGPGSAKLISQMALLTNGAIYAGGDILLNATNSLVISNHLLSAGRKILLVANGLLTDNGVTNGNIWVVGTNSSGSSGGGTLDSGFNIPVKPALGDLLGTTITNYAPYNKTIYNVFGTTNLGLSTNGFVNNAAIGRLVLDSTGPVGKANFVFSGTGTNNAIYVDELIFEDQMTNGINNSFDFSPMLTISNNMMIYFAQAMAGGVSIASKIDSASLAGRNSGGRLRWIPQYTGYFSSTNLVYASGFAHTVNAALAGSTTLDSNGNGIPNAYDPTPFFLPSQVQFHSRVSSASPRKMALVWNSIPGATNYVLYRTNLFAGGWSVLTNFVSPSTVPPVGGWPITNTIYDTFTNQARYYQMRVDPAN